MRTRIRALAAALVATAAIAAVAAQAQDRVDRPGERRGQRIEDIRVAVWTPQKHDEIALLREGQVLDLEQGRTVILRVVAPDKSNPAAERAYLAARYSIERGEDRVRLSNADQGKGWVELTALDGRWQRTDAVVVRWELTEKLLLADDQPAHGTIRVALRPGAAPPVADRFGEEAVTELYRGILLREPDPAAREFVDRVGRGGYDELLRVAQTIAESRESEIDVYARGACNQERLLALHRHLLGVEASSLDQNRWRSELERLGRGDIDGVVLEILRSETYRNRHRLGR